MSLKDKKVKPQKNNFKVFDQRSSLDKIKNKKASIEKEILKLKEKILKKK